MVEYLKSADSDWYRLRLTGAILCVTTAFVILFLRLFYLQVIDGEELRRLSENNCIRLQSIDPPRGLIFDRNGRLLVDNRASFDLSIILTDAISVEDTIEKLSKYTQTSSDEIQSKIARNKETSNYQPVLLKQDVGRNVLAAIEVHKYDLPGICIDVKPRRHYINKQSAAHLIGYLSEINSGELKSGRYPDCKPGDFIGKFGAEKMFEPFLRGKRGGRQVEVNATGQVVRILKAVDTRPGFDIYLTIDQLLQQQAEKLLEGVAGAVVAMEPGTGRLLAMASSPSFDQNAFVSGMSHKQWASLISNPLKPMSNKAVQGEYPPASTFKIVTAIAGLEEGIIDEDSTVFCPGFYKFGNRVYRCWKKGGHGNVNVLSALAESCDTFFYQVGQKLGVDRLAWYAKAFGLGSTTGINLDHEASGLVPTSAWKKRQTGIPWQAGETLSVAIGQGYNLVTPLQMAGLISTIGNGGNRYRPLILKKIVTSTGKVVRKGQTKVNGKLPVSRETLEIVQKGLWEVVNGSKGTARGIRVSDIDISGKTGTAQVYSRKTNEVESEEDIAAHLKSHAWFVAYAPSKDPAIAIAVVVEHGEHGSSTAGPIAKELIQSYLTKDEPESKQVVSR